jgi:hypothetical protein
MSSVSISSGRLVGQICNGEKHFILPGIETYSSQWRLKNTNKILDVNLY